MAVADTTLYDILGVSPSASTSEIKKAYKKLALKHHPDKGGDVKKFQEMTAAHEVLSNEEKRQLYDQHGPEGLRGEAGMQQEDVLAGLFGSLFGGAFPGLFQQPRRRSRQPSPAFRLQVDLLDAFRGAEKRVKVPMTLECKACSGSGVARPEAVKTCPQCQGHGMVFMERRTASMVQRTSMPCQACRGAGRTVPPEALCSTCRSEGTCSSQQTYSVSIPPGAADGQELPTTAEDPAAGPALRCVLSVAEHPRFKRLGDDLACTEHVPLTAALTGALVEVVHLDGRRLQLRRQPGEVIRPGSWWLVREEGMPRCGQPSSRGDLRVHFEVDFPERLPEEALLELAAALRQKAAGLKDGGKARRGAADSGEVIRDMQALDPRGWSGTRSRL